MTTAPRAPGGAATGPVGGFVPPSGPVPSLEPHAAIADIDISVAEGMPGVIAVLTGRDVAADPRHREISAKIGVLERAPELDLGDDPPL